MKPAQLPIYRAVERLMLWAVPYVERLPKSLPYQTLGGLLIRDIRECLDAIILATQASDYTRIEALNILVARMTAVKTTMRVFKNLKKITEKQEVQFLDLINPIQMQAGAWINKVTKEATNPIQNSMPNPQG